MGKLVQNVSFPKKEEYIDIILSKFNTQYVEEVKASEALEKLEKAQLKVLYKFLKNKKDNSIKVSDLFEEDEGRLILDLQKLYFKKYNFVIAVASFFAICIASAIFTAVGLTTPFILGLAALTSGICAISRTYKKSLTKKINNAIEAIESIKNNIQRHSQMIIKTRLTNISFAMHSKNKQATKIRFVQGDLNIENPEICQYVKDGYDVSSSSLNVFFLQKGGTSVGIQPQMRIFIGLPKDFPNIKYEKMKEIFESSMFQINCLRGICRGDIDYTTPLNNVDIYYPREIEGNLDMLKNFAKICFESLKNMPGNFSIILPRDFKGAFEPCVEFVREECIVKCDAQESRVNGRSLRKASVTSLQAINQDAISGGVAHNNHKIPETPSLTF